MFKLQLLFLLTLVLAAGSIGRADAQDRDAGSWDWKGQQSGSGSAVHGVPAKRPALGIAGNPTNVRIEIEGAMRTIPGELVKLITRGSVAERAGLRRGDVIVKWDGKYVGHDGELPQLINNSQGMGPFKIKVVRNGSFRMLDVYFGRVNRAHGAQDAKTVQSVTSNRAKEPAAVGAVLPEPTLPSAKSREQEIDAEIEDILGE